MAVADELEDDANDEAGTIDCSDVSDMEDDMTDEEDTVEGEEDEEDRDTDEETEREELALTEPAGMEAEVDDDTWKVEAEDELGLGASVVSMI